MLKIDIDQFRLVVSSRTDLTRKDICEQFSISDRQYYYLCRIHDIKSVLKVDRSYQQSDAYKEKISKSNLGKIRTESQKLNYRKSAQKRGNNRPIGTYAHTEQTKEKIKLSNKKTYEILPEAWLQATLNSPEWRIQLKQSAIRRIETNTGMTYDEYLAQLSEKEQYYREVRYYTNLNDPIMISGYDSKNKNYHVDHIYSIIDGWYNKISPKIIGHNVNLRFIPAKENQSKNKKSHISKEDLITLYEKHN